MMTLRTGLTVLFALVAGACGSDGTSSPLGPAGASPAAGGSSTGGIASALGGTSSASGGTTLALGGGSSAGGVANPSGGKASGGGSPGGSANTGGTRTTGGTSTGGASSSGGGPATAGGTGNAGGSASSGGGTSSGGASAGGTGTGSGGKTGGTGAGGAPSGGSSTSTGGNGAGGLATGGTSSGGSNSGGAASGGVSTGGSSTGGAATGGSATGGAATGGSATGGTSTGGTATGGTSTTNFSFMLGADISRVQEDEDRGVTYSDGGVKKPILDILKAHGFNYIRLRTFVNPAASGGYSASGYCDLAHTITFGKRVKDAGMGLLLDFHYSDTWADPGNQTKPAAWASLAFDALVTQVHDYTKDAITKMVAGGARPDMVQIGNEIPSGMLFPDGRVSGQNFGNLNRLLNAGIAGVHEIDAGIKIMLHIAFCQDLATTTWWLDGVMGIEPKVTFDVFAQSCYDEANYQQPASNWEPNFQSLASNSKYNSLKFAVAEYSQQKRMVNDMMYNLPNGRGIGTFIWEPEYWRETIFDWQGNTEVTNSNMSLYDQMATDYGLR